MTTCLTDLPAPSSRSAVLLDAARRPAAPAAGHDVTSCYDVRVHDVVHAAWLASGAPALTRERMGEGRCARCGRHDALTPMRKVLSKQFTGFDGWSSERGGLCPACTWAYTTPSLRSGSHAVTRDPAGLRPLSLRQLRTVLGEPVAPDIAVCVPARANRKHVLPAASWGRVTFDDVSLSWGSDDAMRLGLVAAFRAAGCPATRLAHPAPPWSLVEATPVLARGRLMAQWSLLDPWRRRRPWLELALLATSAAR